MKPLASRLADLGTVVMMVAALGMTGLVIRQQFFPPPAPGTVDIDVSDDWAQFIEGGLRIGPDDAAVTIVEFGDYECPFCRTFHPVLSQILGEFPEDVALIYRFYPLDYHPSAYPTARMALCAKDQGRFKEAHDRLYEIEELAEIDPTVFGEEVGVYDAERFIQCSAAELPRPEVQADLALAEKLNVNQTPTIVVDGLQLARRPNVEELRALIVEALAERR